VKPNTLGILGLGALGGSIARQASRAGVSRIVGCAHSTKDGVAAARSGAVTEIAHDPQGVVRAADFVVMATPPASTLGLLEELAEQLRRREVYCTDVTRVKTPVVQLAERLDLQPWFADALESALVYVTPLAGGDAAHAEVADFWQRVIGAAPVTLAAERHDALLAWTSQLPRAVASALARVLAEKGPDGVTYGRSALEETRAATEDPAAWADLFLMGRQGLLEALDAMEDGLGEFRAALSAGDRDAVKRWLEAGADWRGRFDS
jgi:prephenate dehydrogenase